MKTFLQYCNLSEAHRLSAYTASAAMPDVERHRQLDTALTELDALGQRLHQLLFHSNPKLADYILHQFQHIHDAAAM